MHEILKTLYILLSPGIQHVDIVINGRIKKRNDFTFFVP